MLPCIFALIPELAQQHLVLSLLLLVTKNFGVMTGVQHDALPCAFMFNSTGPQGSPNGTFSSPNFPGFYPRDTECHYFFHGDTNQRVRLHFHYFDVEGVLP
ncbi:hypothetical protein J6590_081774 [Homalodisca vitripennis]|nr:hypothetical protein J6590_081774 [Homalodisca vitripennis]